ncbi:MAG: hypothetical protein C4K47_05215 [Candidatus Thorarchaeota archaeon]|nr:MAG: hypothetical protein C4K47_05215 [Candidatus Thorarchaeota archaeon]
MSVSLFEMLDAVDSAEVVKYPAVFTHKFPALNTGPNVVIGAIHHDLKPVPAMVSAVWTAAGAALNRFCLVAQAACPFPFRGGFHAFSVW